MGRFDLALGDCDRYLAFKKDNANVWIDRAMLKKQLGRCVEAIPDFDEALRQNGLDGAVYVERAKCFKALGNTAAMRTDIQKAQSLGVKNIDSAHF